MLLLSSGKNIVFLLSKMAKTTNRQRNTHVCFSTFKKSFEISTKQLQVLKILSNVLSIGL